MYMYKYFVETAFRLPELDLACLQCPESNRLDSAMAWRTLWTTAIALTTTATADRALVELSRGRLRPGRGGQIWFRPRFSMRPWSTQSRIIVSFIADRDVPLHKTHLTKYEVTARTRTRTRIPGRRVRLLNRVWKSFPCRNRRSFPSRGA